MTTGSSNRDTERKSLLTRDATPLSRGRVVVILSSLLVVTAVVAIVTDGLPPLIAAAFLILVLAASRTLDYVVAVALSLLGVLLTILISGMLAPLGAVSLVHAVTIAMVLAGCGGLAAFAIAGRQPAVKRPSGLTLKAWFASASGAVVWAVAYLVSLRLAPVDRLEWVVRNDSLNNLVFARMVIQDGGIAVGADENPAPLPATLIALWALDGRSRETAELILQHDLGAMMQVWAVLIGITCILAGLTVASIASAMGAKGLPVALGGVFGSLMVLSWIVTGYPMLYGFLNTHLILPVLLSTILLSLRARDAPVAALVGLLLASTVILAVWAPLVVVPAALFILVAFVHRKQLWPLRMRRGIPLIVSVALLLAYGILVTLPIYLRQRPALSGLGGIFDVGPLVVPIAIGVIVLIALAIRRGGQVRQPLPVVIAVFASAVAGLSFLLFLNRHYGALWSYYPIKFTWLMLIVLTIMGLGLLVGLSAGLASRRLRAIPVAAAGVLCGAILLWMPTVGGGPLALNAVARAALGHVIDQTNGLTRGILENHHPGELTLLWESDEVAEGEINIWLTLLYIGALDQKTELRILSLQAFTDRSVTMLCAISEEADDELVVVTARDDLDLEIQETCPSRSDEISVQLSK